MTNYNFWDPRDTMAWWQDGASNQVLLGEKHLPPGVFGVCALGAATIYDCSYLIGGHSCMPSFGRLVRHQETPSRIDMNDGAVRLARPTDPVSATISSSGPGGSRSGYFGSSHPDVVNFLFGDGAVMGLPLTTNPLIVAYLGTVDDGNVVTLP